MSYVVASRGRTLRCRGWKERKCHVSQLQGEEVSGVMRTGSGVSGVIATRKGSVMCHGYKERVLGVIKRIGCLRCRSYKERCHDNIGSVPDIIPAIAGSVKRDIYKNIVCQVS